MTPRLSDTTMKELAEQVGVGMAEIILRRERQVLAEADLREQSLRDEIKRLRGKLQAVDAAAQPRKAA